MDGDLVAFSDHLDLLEAEIVRGGKERPDRLHRSLPRFRRA